MSTYVISDLHGDYEGYVSILDQIRFSNKDILYVNGDVIDRGDGGIRILQHMMLQPNVYPILGNHEYMAATVLRFLMREITEESIQTLDAGIVEGILQWQNVGGQVTLDAFHQLSRDEKLDIIEYLDEFSLYEEVYTGGKNFVIVHAGLMNFSPERSMDEYQLHELLFAAPDYEQVYFEDRYLITGHLPTRAIEGAQEDRIYMKNNHIAIDCGAGYGGCIGAVRLEDMKTYYSERR